jgi:hypothetical protein
MPALDRCVCHAARTRQLRLLVARCRDELPGRLRGAPAIACATSRVACHLRAPGGLVALRTPRLIATSFPSSCVLLGQHQPPHRRCREGRPARHRSVRPSAVRCRTVVYRWRGRHRVLGSRVAAIADHAHAPADQVHEENAAAVRHRRGQLAVVSALLSSACTAAFHQLRRRLSPPRPARRQRSSTSSRSRRWLCPPRGGAFRRRPEAL